MLAERAIHVAWSKPLMAEPMRSASVLTTIRQDIRANPPDIASRRATVLRFTFRFYCRRLVTESECGFLTLYCIVGRCRASQEVSRADRSIERCFGTHRTRTRTTQDRDSRDRRRSALYNRMSRMTQTSMRPTCRSSSASLIAGMLALVIVRPSAVVQRGWDSTRSRSVQNRRKKTLLR